MVCNNDQTIKVFSVPTMNLITTLNYTAAVNNVGVSPDGTMMAVVGDSNQIHLHSVSNSSEYKKMGVLTGTKNTLIIIFINIQFFSCKRCRILSFMGQYFY